MPKKQTYETLIRMKYAVQGDSFPALIESLESVKKLCADMHSDGLTLASSDDDWYFIRTQDKALAKKYKMDLMLE